MFIKLNEKNEIIDIQPNDKGGYIDFPEIYQNRKLIDDNFHYLYKLVNNQVIEIPFAERYSVADYVKILDDTANQLTYEALRKTDYIEIRECDPDEPHKLSKADLKIFRENRRQLRNIYRQLSEDLLQATSVAECDLIYKTWEANYATKTV